MQTCGVLIFSAKRGDINFWSNRFVVYFNELNGFMASGNLKFPNASNSPCRIGSTGASGPRGKVPVSSALAASDPPVRPSGDRMTESLH